MISLQYAGQRNADGNSQLATTLHKLYTYLSIKPEQTLTRMERDEHNTGTIIREA